MVTVLQRPSPVRGLIIIFCCVALNLLGAYVCRKAESFLFLDLVGTAVASLIYGPIHGALVGLLTNGIAELALHQRHYFLFALVQVVCAGTWGLVPRVLKGRLCTDFFSDDGLKDNGTRDNDYGYAQLLCGVVWLSLFSHLLASLTIGLLIYAEPTLACPALAELTGTNNPNLPLCWTAMLLFSEPTLNLSHPVWELAAAKLVLGWPDHLIALSFAILMTASFLPDARHKMDGSFNKPGTWRIVIITAATFVVLTIIRIYIGFTREQEMITDLLPWLGYTLVFLLVLVLLATKYEMRDRDLAPHPSYTRINRDLEHAFEDALTLGVIVSTIIFIAVNSLCPADGGGPPFCRANLKDKFVGALGIAFIITFFRYISIILSRCVRSLRHET